MYVREESTVKTAVECAPAAMEGAQQQWNALRRQWRERNSSGMRSGGNGGSATAVVGQ